MVLQLQQSKTALSPNTGASFLGVGGTAPYLYSVTPSGAGGSIDSNTGVYAAPAVASSDPAFAYDTIQVTDAALAVATAKILVGTPLLLFCEMLQRELNLADGRVYLWDQKIMQPTDAGLYVAVSVSGCRPFGSSNRGAVVGNDYAFVQFIAMQATLDLDIISRGPDARDRKEEVILALGSLYSQQQQEANSFNIARLPVGGRFINLSQIDGAAIPYRYRISVNIQYAFAKTTSSSTGFYDYFTTQLVTDPGKVIDMPAIFNASEQTDNFTLSPTDITNKYVQLSKIPLLPANTKAFIKGNTEGVYGDDFTVDTVNNRISWAGLGFDGVVVAGDKLISTYWYQGSL